MCDVCRMEMHGRQLIIMLLIDVLATQILHEGSNDKRCHNMCYIGHVAMLGLGDTQIEV
jgi:hypothetical protein